MTQNIDPASTDGLPASMHPMARLAQADRLLLTSGYVLVLSSVLCFGVIAYLKVSESFRLKASIPLTTWLDFVQQESGTLGLLIIAVIAATLGKRLLTTARMADARTIPYEDLPLVSQAVIDGKSEPIDQYVRLRSLSGISGNFTKLGVTGLPLTTVALTLMFSFIALLPVDAAAQFLDLAKLTLGAFIGSFVQGRVEQRKQRDADPTAPRPRSDLIA